MTDPTENLDKALADDIAKLNAEYDAFLDVELMGLQKAISIGRRLQDTKSRVHERFGYKGWGNWIVDNLNFNQDRANAFMRTAKLDDEFGIWNFQNLTASFASDLGGKLSKQRDVVVELIERIGNGEHVTPADLDAALGKDTQRRRKKEAKDRRERGENVQLAGTMEGKPEPESFAARMREYLTPAEIATAARKALEPSSDGVAAPINEAIVWLHSLGDYIPNRARLPGPRPMLIDGGYAYTSLEGMVVAGAPLRISGSGQHRIVVNLDELALDAQTYLFQHLQITDQGLSYRCRDPREEDRLVDNWVHPPLADSTVAVPIAIEPEGQSYPLSRPFLDALKHRARQYTVRNEEDFKEAHDTIQRGVNYHYIGSWAWSTVFVMGGKMFANDLPVPPDLHSEVNVEFLPSDLDLIFPTVAARFVADQTHGSDPEEMIVGEDWVYFLWPDERFIAARRIKTLQKPIEGQPEPDGWIWDRRGWAPVTVTRIETEEIEMDENFEDETQE